MTEVLAAHCAIAALYLGEGTTHDAARVLDWSFVRVAICLALPIRARTGACRRLAIPPRPGLLAVAVSGLRVGAAAFLRRARRDHLGRGVPVDLAELRRNSLQGVATAIGTGPLATIWNIWPIALMPLPLLLGLAAVGATAISCLGDRRAWRPWSCTAWCRTKRCGSSI
jgi:hypothetical protein